MNEEKFNPNVADADTMLIVARLGERKRKLERMAEMEHRLARRTTARLYTSIVSAMAAVVLLTLVLVLSDLRNGSRGISASNYAWMFASPTLISE